MYLPNSCYEVTIIHTPKPSKPKYKIELQTKLSYNHRYNNSQKTYLLTKYLNTQKDYQVGFITEMKRCFDIHKSM